MRHCHVQREHADFSSQDIRRMADRQIGAGWCLVSWQKRRCTDIQPSRCTFLTYGWRHCSPLILLKLNQVFPPFWALDLPPLCSPARSCRLGLCHYRPLQPFLTAAGRNYHTFSGWKQQHTFIQFQFWRSESEVGLTGLKSVLQGNLFFAFTRSQRLPTLLGFRLHLSEFCLLWCTSFYHTDPSASLVKGPLWLPWGHLNNPS